MHDSTCIFGDNIVNCPGFQAKEWGMIIGVFDHSIVITLAALFQNCTLVMRVSGASIRTWLRGRRGPCTDVHVQIKPCGGGGEEGAGLLLYVTSRGESRSAGGDFLSLSLHRGRVQLRYRPGEDPVTVVNGRSTCFVVFSLAQYSTPMLNDALCNPMVYT